MVGPGRDESKRRKTVGEGGKPRKRLTASLSRKPILAGQHRQVRIGHPQGKRAVPYFGAYLLRDDFFLLLTVFFPADRRLVGVDRGDVRRAATAGVSSRP